MMEFDAAAQARSVLAVLSAAGTPERAANEKRYLKSAMIHYGATVPFTRNTGMNWCRAHPEATRLEILGVVEALWGSGVFEARMASAEILKVSSGKLLMDDFTLLERLLRESRTWALVDTISTGACSLLQLRFPESGLVLDGWAADDDFWLRRAAMLTLLRPLAKGGGDFDRFSRYADSMLEEKEFFIRKAIGWILREISKKRPDLAAGWLRQRKHRASGLTLREATKHLSAELKEELKKR